MEMGGVATGPEKRGKKEQIDGTTDGMKKAGEETRCGS